MKSLFVIFILSPLLLAGCQDSHHVIVSNSAGPDTALARQLTSQAHGLIQQEKYEKAEPLLQNAIQADPMYGPARNDLGLVYYHCHFSHSSGKEDRQPVTNVSYLYLAAREFENAIKLMPFQPEPRNNLGMVLEAAEKYSEAIAYYERARKMEPDNPEFTGNLARVHYRRGDRDAETKRLLEDVVYKDPRANWRKWAQEKLAFFRVISSEPGAAPLPGNAKP